MAITIARTSALMQTRLEPLLVAAGFTFGADTDLEDAIGYALRELGHSVADAIEPTDAELTAVTNVNHYLDLVELRSLETSHTRLLLKVDLAVGPRRQQYSQIATGLETAITRKRKELMDKYGSGVVIDMAFKRIEE
jgi:hypothetical protein